jgi:hypothetical protein
VPTTACVFLLRVLPILHPERHARQAAPAGSGGADATGMSPEGDPGTGHACPRDACRVVGDEIIEAHTGWRDLVVARSNVTNAARVAWLRRPGTLRSCFQAAEVTLGQPSLGLKRPSRRS